MAKLKAFYAKQEEVPKEHVDFYTEKDGKWILDTDVREHPETLALRNALTGEREKASERQKRLEAYEAAGLSPEQIKALDEDAAKLREEQAKKGGDLETLVKQRVEAALKAKDKEIAILTQDNAAMKASLSTLQITGAVRTAAAKHGVRPEALDDVELRAARIFTLENGKPVAKENGTIIYGKNGADPMSPEEWVEGLAAKATHLFNPSNGSGSGGENQGKPLPPGSKFVENTPQAIGANLEKIAKGELEVRT